MSDPLISQTIGGCTILEVIGQGGMGVIYKGRQKSLDRVVAVKVLAPHLANDVTFVTRFQKEARSIARVNHPHILAVYDVGTDQNINYMIMELIEGESLAELQAERRGALDWREATEYIRQSAQGLEAAQSAGIIHRDIKPENLMVTRKGQIKVSDFGLAKESDGTGTQTSIDSVMGTPAFMSPEQCDGKKVDGRSDIYSLGGTWYRLITGRLPFEAETAMSTMYRHKHEALIPPNEVLPTIPRSVSDVIVKMMAKKREHRYQTFTEVIEAVDQALKRADDREVSDQAAFGERTLTPVPGNSGGYDDQRASAASRFANPPQGDYSRQGLSGAGGGAGGGGGGTNLSGMRRGVTNVARAPIPGMGGGFMPAASEQSRFNTGVGLPNMSNMSGMDEGYANVSRGDELLERGDRVNAIKAYILAMQSNTLDNATRGRVEQEINHEFATRRTNADNLLKRGMLVDAQRECRILADLDPNDEPLKALLKDIEGRLALKRTLVNDIRNAIAGSQFENAIKIWDGTPPELRDEGLGKQIEQLRIIVVPAAKLAEQGENFAQQGRLEEAIATYEDAMKINPSCEQARMGLKDAESKLQRIDYLLKEGYQYNLEQNYAKAIETWKPILNLRPGHPQAIKSIVEAYIQHGQTLRAQGDLDGAMALYRGARDTDPANRTIARMTDEITLLRDKEKQLLDRAQDAMNKGRLGEAIHCWKDIYALNPANRKAQQQIAQIAKRRSGNAALTFVMVIVIAAAAICGYQYFQEKTLIAKAQALSDEHKYLEALTVLKKNTFLFYAADVKHMKEDADDENEAQEAEVRSEADLKAGSDMYKNLAERLKQRKPAVSKHLYELALKNLSKLYLGQAREALKLNNWEAAVGHYSKLEREMRNIPDRTDELKAAEAELNSGKFMANQLIEGDKQALSSNVEIAYARYKDAEKIAQELNITEARDYIDKRLKDFSFDPNKYQEGIDNGAKILEQATPDLAAAKAAFEQALKNRPNDAKALMYLSYIDDLKFCSAKNQSMYSAKRPGAENKNFTWNADDRKGSFCIDRYEFPNIEGVIPTANVPYVIAKSECEKAGKVLCTRLRWEDACKGSSIKNSFPYGNGHDPDVSTCNVEGEKALPSGAKSTCKNSIGVYDMSGNLAEWTLEQNAEEGAAESATIKGGSFRNKAGETRCEDEFTERKDAANPQIGFRCCRDLEARK